MISGSVRAPETLSPVERRPDLEIPVHGDTVAATRYTPRDVDGPLPALLMYVPYHKDDFITFGYYDPIVRYLAASGYEVIVADMVGTDASTGHINEMFTKREGREPAAIIEWLADQEWTSGRIGMFGKSYGGITTLSAAAERPEPLEAIVPIETPYQGYRNAYTQGGAFQLLTIGMDWLTLMQVLDVKPPTRRDPDGRWAEVWDRRLDSVRERDPWLFQFLDHQEPLGEYWADKNIAVEDIDTPTLAVGGWRDPYPLDTVEFFEAIDAPKRLVMGPWRHTMPHRGRESAIDFRPQVVEWFDHFLKDEDNGALEWPRISYWTERRGGGKVGEGCWRGRNDWPAADTDETLTFAFTPEGLRPVDGYTAGAVEREYEFDHTVGLESTNPFGAEIEPMDSNGDDARSVCYETGALDEAVELTGTGRATVRLVPSTSDQLLVVRVIDVAPDGTATYVTRGVARLSLVDDLTQFRELTPGEEYEFDLTLRPKSHVFEPGHAIRVAVSAAYFPENLPTPEQGSLTLLSSPTHPSSVSLPGRRHDNLSFEDAVTMRPPDDRIAPTSQYLTVEESKWRTCRERTGNTASVQRTFDTSLNLPNARMRRRGTFEASVVADDPTTVTARNQTSMTIRYATETVEIDATNQITQDGVRVSTKVTRDGVEVFDETWVR